MSSDLYARVLSRAGLSTGDTVLVTCGGPNDRDALVRYGMPGGIISNIDYHDGIKDYTPFEWQYQDAEAVTHADKSFDWTIVSAGLHHCSSPHKALCELYRIARKGVIVMEARDSALLRLAVRIGLTADYELEPAAISGGKVGGYRNTLLPNYIYRWTERELEKTVRSYAPDRTPRIEYVYGYAVPLERLTMVRNPIKRAVGRAGVVAVSVAKSLFPKQGNEFGIIIRKNTTLQPWLEETPEGVRINMDYIHKKYDPKAYRRSARPA